MKRLILILTAFLSLPALFISCEKDNLTGDYDKFEGKYEWVYSRSSYREWIFGQLRFHYDSASDASYTAQIQFDNTSHVTFYIDDAELVKKKFKIKDQYKDGNTFFMELKVDVNKNDLDINDKLEVSCSSPDTIYVAGFPGTGYDDKISGGNYFVRID